MVAEAACIPDSQAAWVRSTLTEAKIQALVDQGLLRSKTEVEWRAAVGEDFSSEDVKEQVVFSSFFERGFNLPAGDFFRGMLYYYRLELVSGTALGVPLNNRESSLNPGIKAR
jgi:hypothetical protein